MKVVMREVLMSREFWVRARISPVTSWPGGIRGPRLKDAAGTGFSVNGRADAVANMGRSGCAPPDVSGWDAGTPGSRPARCSAA